MSPLYPDLDRSLIITEQRAKIDFEMRFALTCDAAWVSCPTYFELMNICRSFQIKVSPQGLTPGAHYTEVSHGGNSV